MTLQVNLHQHGEGSFLDGYARNHEMVSRAVELGMSHVALTDHGECNQHLALAKECAKAGIGFVPGMEGYWLHAEDIEYHRAQSGPQRYPRPSHLCLLAQNEIGLHNLWALSSEAYLGPQFDYKPLVTPEIMTRYAEGLYASDGCLLTRLAEAVEAGDEDRARQLLGTLHNIYRERFYMELHTWQFMDDTTPEHMALNARMRRLNHAKVRLATEMGIPLVVVNDSHHAYPEHWLNREYVWAFSTASDPDKLKAQQEAMSQKADHLMGEDEIYFWMGKHGIAREVITEAIANSAAIAASCRVEISPTLSVPRLGKDEAEDLRVLVQCCEEGFQRHVVDAGLPAEPYFARLETELRLIAEKNFAGYFRVVRDYVVAYRSGSWSQFVHNDPHSPKAPLLVGPGRGSVGGSLVAYLVGIDQIDPLKYRTLFSRFLSPSRQGLPDIDVDVPQSQRPDALNYIRARFGDENVCAIGTLSRNGPRQTLRDLGRALRVPIEDVNAMSKTIEEVERLRGDADPDEEELTYGELVERRHHELAPWAHKYPELFEKLGQLSGLVRHSGVHAAGILVSSEPLQGRVPLRRTKKKVVSTQLDMWEVEELGGVKIDLLGIRHLDTLSHARQLIYERHGVWIDYDATGLSVPPGCADVLSLGDEQFRDPAIWEQIDAGQTLGVFQVETSNCTQAAVHFRPRSEVDVADLTSIIRPGVADAGLKEVYLNRRSGLDPVRYDHPLMERFVGPQWATNTYGVLVYQEQLMECVQVLGKFSPDEAEELRKAVGKKNMDKLMALKSKFAAGCLASPEFTAPYGGPPEGAYDRHAAQTAIDRIWASIEASGRYAFNWSHAVGYALISSWEIWTKHYYPQEFLVALMATDAAGINRYVREARRRGVTILPPDINRSERKFSIDGGAIRYGLDTIRGVGRAACRDILSHRPYRDMEDYLNRSGGGADKTVAYNLILIGAFEEMGTRAEMLGVLERFRAREGLVDATLSNADKLEKTVTRRLTENPGRYRIPVPDFQDRAVMYEIEKNLVGTYVTVDPLERYVPLLDTVALRDPADLLDVASGEMCTVGGMVTSLTKTVTKKGRNPGAEMAQMVVQWNEADFRVVVFPDAWGRCKLLLEVGAPVACKVKRLSGGGCCLESVERLDLFCDRMGIN